MQELLQQVNLEKLWHEYHVIAMNYHWDREAIRNLPKTERERWVEYIIKTLEAMYGSGKGGKVDNAR